MPRLIILGRGGVIDAARVVAIAPFRSKPVKRLLDATGADRLINLTYGYPRRSIIVLEGGYVAVSSRSVSELARIFDSGAEEMSDDTQPPWWP